MMSDEEATTTLPAKEPYRDVVGEYRNYLEKQDGISALLNVLQGTITPDNVFADKIQRQFEGCGWYYRVNQRLHEALLVYEALYDRLLTCQVAAGSRVHKGNPLVWIAECHAALNRFVIAKRYLMLTVCEDAITEEGKLAPESTGAYFRLVWHFGLPHNQLQHYVAKIWDVHHNNEIESRFPEWILQELDSEWMTEYPSSQETAVFRISRPYVSHLITTCSDGDGKGLERLAHYLIAAMPGCRAYLRLKSHSTDYDVTGVFEGPVQDFRSDIGRYFVCECKDWAKPANFTVMAKFCRVLDSTKARLGILFSKEGITGSGRLADAELEQVKVFQDRGIVIVVVSKADLCKIADGESFITMLRAKYESVRLGLQAATKPKRKRRSNVAKPSTPSE